MVAMAFLLVGMTACGGAFAAAQNGAPVWAIALAFFAPMLLVIVVLKLWGKRLLGVLRNRLPSPERQALGQAARRSAAGAPVAPGGDWPTVPQAPAAAERPATLKVRLTPEASPAPWIAGCLTVLAVGLLCMLAPAASKAIGGLLRGQPDWGQTLLAIAFLVGGLAAVGFALYFVGQVLAQVLAGPIVVEISANPLTAGGRHEIWATQQGRSPVHDLHLRLACVESVTYRQGTSTATSTREVYTQDVLHPSSSLPGTSLLGGVRCPLDLPPGVMHSFTAANNEIGWKLHLRGRVGILTLRMRFRLIVHPESP
jgi:hypothetical protein